MIVVSNTTPLIGLASIGRFSLLQTLFGTIQIPEAVFHEVVVAGRDDGGARREVSSSPWVKTVAILNRNAVDALVEQLDLGEAEAIVLSQQLGADWTLMDERKGRQKLDEYRMSKLGTLGILLKAKRLGIISKLRPEVDLLRVRGFSVSQDVVDAVLRHASE